MEENLPRCVLMAWDLVDESLAPVMLLPLCLQEEGMPWALPLYPKLGHLTWDDQEVDQELHSGPCGLLQPDCPRHGPKAQSTSRPDAERPNPHLALEKEESEMPSAVEDAAYTLCKESDSHPGLEADAQTPVDDSPEDCLHMLPGSLVRQLDPETSEELPLPPTCWTCWLRICLTVAAKARAYLRYLLSLEFVPQTSPETSLE